MGTFYLPYLKRSIIIAVDNRAIEISNDTNLPSVKRENIKDELENLIVSDFKTEIKLPMENIKRWKSQFKKDYVHGLEE